MTQYVDWGFKITRMARCLRHLPDGDLANEDLVTELLIAKQFSVQDIVDFHLIVVDVERIRRDIARRPTSMKNAATGE